jgi:hypothetical protein
LLTAEALTELLHQPALGKTDKLLLCLAVDDGRPKAVKEIKSLAVRAGLRAAKTWNVSDLLSKSAGRAIRTDAGWELRAEGREYVANLAGPMASLPVPKIAAGLRSHLPKLSHPQTAAFIEEAIRCYEQRLYRAAVVLSWVGAVSLLYHEVVTNHLATFNAEAVRRNNKWKNATTVDDLSRMKEKDFLDILDHLSIIGKNVKQELEGCLTLRNGCGHPNSLVIGEQRVAAHVEALLLNVFAPFT